MAIVDTILVPKFNKLTITPDAGAIGHLVQVYDNGNQPNSFQAISASTPISVGPFDMPTKWRVTLVSGSYVYVNTVSVVNNDGATDIAPNSVTYGQIQKVSATSKFLGRKSSGSGNIEELSNSDAKTILSISYTDVSGLAAVAHSGAYADLSGAPSLGTMSAQNVTSYTNNTTLAATYLTQSSASSTYETKSHATATYATIASLGTFASQNTSNWMNTTLANQQAFISNPTVISETDIGRAVNAILAALIATGIIASS